jgi:hypothetical protein
MEGHMATKQTAAVAAKTGTMKVPATAAAAQKQTGALTPAAKDAPPKAPSKFVATVTWEGAAKRVHVAEYQDMTFAVNPTRKLTDVELAADWRRVFPNAVTYTEFHVQGARRDFNAGRHSKEFRGRTFSVLEFILVDGKRTPVTEAPKPEPKATAPVAPKAETKLVAPKATTTAPVAKAKGMTIKTNRAKAA